jgi:hypothetical protein
MVEERRECLILDTLSAKFALADRVPPFGGQGRFSWKIARFDFVAGTTDDRRTRPSLLRFWIKEVHLRRKNNIRNRLSKASPFSHSIFPFSNPQEIH